MCVSLTDRTSTSRISTNDPPRIRHIYGAFLHEGDTIVLAVTGAHTIATLDRHSKTRADGMRHAHCTEGTCCSLFDHHLYRRAA